MAYSQIYGILANYDTLAFFNTVLTRTRYAKLHCHAGRLVYFAHFNSHTQVSSLKVWVGSLKRFQYPW